MAGRAAKLRAMDSRTEEVAAMMMEELECEFCGQNFSSVEQLESHQELLHSDELGIRELEEAMAEEDVDDHDSQAAAHQFDEAFEEHEARVRNGGAA